MVLREDCHKHIWISYDEAASITGYQKTTLYTMAARREIRTRKRGMYRVDRLSLEQFMGVKA